MPILLCMKYLRLKIQVFKGCTGLSSKVGQCCLPFEQVSGPKCANRISNNLLAQTNCPLQKVCNRTFTTKNYITFFIDFNNVKNNVPINPLTAERALRALIDFTLSNSRRFYPSMGNLLDGKGLKSSDFGTVGGS